MAIFRNLMIGAAFASALALSALANAEVAPNDTSTAAKASSIGIDPHTTTNSGMNRENPAVGTNKATPTSDVTVQGTLSPSPMGAAPATQNTGGLPQGDIAKNNTTNKAMPPSCIFSKDAKGVWRNTENGAEVSAAEAAKANCTHGM